MCDNIAYCAGKMCHVHQKLWAQVLLSSHLLNLYAGIAVRFEPTSEQYTHWVALH